MEGLFGLRKPFQDLCNTFLNVMLTVEVKKQLGEKIHEFLVTNDLGDIQWKLNFEGGNIRLEGVRVSDQIVILFLFSTIE